MLNIIDYAILAFFALSLLVGLYRGSVATALNLVAVGAALLVAKLCYPLVSEWIAGHETWMNYLVYFSEGSSHITTEMMEYARTDLTSLTQEQIALVISNANFTPPFDTYLANNVAGLVYAGTYNTLFDYFNQTVADASLNTISFVLLFLFTYVVASLLVTLVQPRVQLPGPARTGRRGRRRAGARARVPAADGAGDHDPPGRQHAADRFDHRHGGAVHAAESLLSKQLVL